MAVTKYSKIKKICKKNGLKVEKNLVSSGRYWLKAPAKFKRIIGVTIHNTDNDASAENEVSYMIRNEKQAGFHFAVDDKKALLGIPLSRHCWHSGDGLGNGNMKTIGIEICYNKLARDNAKFLKGEKNAAILTKAIMETYGFNMNDIYQHHDWSGKNCPSKTRRLGWKRWLKIVKAVGTGDPADTIKYRVKRGPNKILGNWQKDGKIAGNKKSYIRSIECFADKGDLKVRVRSRKTKLWSPWCNEREWTPNCIFDRIQFSLDDGKTDIQYRVYTKEHGWLDWVTNYNNRNDSGYAGWDGCGIRMIEVKA